MEGGDPVKVDVRLIAATNKNLEDEVQKGLFREDLFYRINVIAVPLPPLRERKEDIPLLVHHFLQKYAPRLGKPSIRISREAMQVLVNYDWPGNVRELENMVERTVALCEGDTIETADLPEKLTRVRIAIRDLDQYQVTLDALEEEHIKKVLLKVNGDKVKAAQILGINLSTLYRKLARYTP